MIKHSEETQTFKQNISTFNQTFYSRFCKMPVCVFFQSLDIKKTRMKTYINTKFKKSDNQTNIDKYRVVTNITEYHIISKLVVFRRIINSKFMMIRQLFHKKMYVEMLKN